MTRSCRVFAGADAIPTTSSRYLSSIIMLMPFVDFPPLNASPAVASLLPISGGSEIMIPIGEIATSLLTYDSSRLPISRPCSIEGVTSKSISPLLALVNLSNDG